MALPGKDVVVKVSTSSGGTYTQVDELNDFSMSQSGNNIDISEFGVDWVKRMQALKDVTYSGSGFWDPDDTNGQVAIRSAWLNDTALWITVLPDGSTGFKGECKVGSFDISAGVNDAIAVSFDLEGTGSVGGST